MPLGNPATDRPFVSVVVTVKDEAPHIEALLESLAVQEPPFEIRLVDALSRDNTVARAETFAARHPGMLTIERRYGSRGIGRNTGVEGARGPFVAFIDGDCLAAPDWLARLRDGFAKSDVVAGRTEALGGGAFTDLERVELYLAGSDVTHPSCNLGYRRTLFERLGGFDPRFITAEDIDLNLRAVRSGAEICYCPEAVVSHRVRSTLFRFLVQAFWNGYGRKQLTEKHGSLWGRYRLRRLLSGQRSPLAWARLAAALAGYLTRVLTGSGHRLGHRVSAPPESGTPRAESPTEGERASSP
jgi:glycosyltransferase involved in cell wall biosynthesis